MLSKARSRKLSCHCTSLPGQLMTNGDDAPRKGSVVEKWLMEVQGGTGTLENLGHLYSLLLCHATDLAEAP